MRKLMNSLLNPLMKWLLRSPLHWLVSRQYMLIAVTGRKTGKVYVTPVQYHRDGEQITVITSRAYSWWKNLRGSAAVRLRIEGRDYDGTATPSDEQQAIASAFRRVYPRATPAQIEQFLPRTIAVQITLVPATVGRATNPLSRA